jgi:hypothetical protein
MRRQLFLQHQKHQPRSNAEGRALRVFRVTRFTAENIYDVDGLMKSSA